MQYIRLTGKNQSHVYTSINNLKNKLIIPLAIASKGIKYLGINLTKEVKDSYKQNFKTLLKEIREDINKWKYNVSYIH